MPVLLALVPVTPSAVAAKRLADASITLTAG
jgi:hypothetical protein